MRKSKTVDELSELLSVKEESHEAVPKFASESLAETKVGRVGSPTVTRETHRIYATRYIPVG